MPDIAGALTRKVGPLPVWAWGGIVGGGFLAARVLTGGGVGSGGIPVGATITDAASGAGDLIGGGTGSGTGGTGGTGTGTGTGGSGSTDNGATQPPAGTGSTGTVGGNGSVTVLKLTGATALYRESALSKIFRTLSPQSWTSFRVKPVTLGGKNYWRIISGAAGQKTNYANTLIPRGRKTYTITTTTAA